LYTPEKHFSESNDSSQVFQQKAPLGALFGRHEFMIYFFHDY
jgi:hypothetical protein